jgi:hypothetical protein
MAFNPFRAFRKHQKVMFAALTILCMMTFVLCGSIGGDLGERIVSLFRGRAGQVATLYGKAIDYRDLNHVRYQRQLANAFMATAIERARGNVFGDVLGKLKGQDAEQLKQILGMSRGDPSFMLDFFRDQLQRDNKTSEANAVDLLKRVMADSANDLSRRGKFFGGTDKTSEMLDFLIWQHEADRLGIQLTSAGVVAEIDRVTYGHFTAEDSAFVEQMLRRDKRFEAATTDDIHSALAAEFRARLAQIALVGAGPLDEARAVAMLTPAEYMDYFRKNRTEVTVAVTPVPAERFLAEVKEQPSQGELTALFNKYKDREYDPTVETPGFKLPLRAKAEWATADPNSTFYRQEAEKVDTIARGFAQFGAAAAANVPGHPVTALALLAAVRQPVDLRVLAEYEKYRDNTRSKIRSHEQWVDNRGPGLRYAPAAASVIAQLAPMPLGAPLLKAPGAVVARDRVVARLGADEVRRGAARILAGTMPAPFITVPVLGSKEDYHPLDSMKAGLEQKVKERLAREVLSANLIALKQDLEQKKKYNAKPEVLQRILAEGIKKYHLQTGASTRLGSQFDIGRDEGLEPLKAAFDKEVGAAAARMKQMAAFDRQQALFANPYNLKPKDFAKLFFAGRAEPDPTGMSREPPRAEVDTPRLWPQEYFFTVDPSQDHRQFLFWKTAEEKPRVPESLDQVKDQVEHAWKLEKARVLAHQKAEQIADELWKAGGDVDPILVNEAGKLSEAKITLDGVAPLVRNPTAAAGRSQYRPYQVPEDTFTYPRDNIVEELLAMREPNSQVKVFSNKPQTVYYVAAVSNPVKDDLNTSMWTAFRMDSPVLQVYEQKRAEEYREEVLKQLRAEAKLVIHEDESKRESRLEDQ